MIEEHAGDIFVIAVAAAMVLFFSVLFFVDWHELDIKDKK